MTAPLEQASAPPAGVAPPLEAELPELSRKRGITWRSLLLGTVGVILICALVPYNDFVLSDTSLAAGFLPLSAVLMAFILVICINGPLHWAEGRRQRAVGRTSLPTAYRLLPTPLGTQELAVILLMVLVASSLPNWGLMRFLIPMPVAPFFLGSQDGAFWDAFLALDLPPWLFPVENMEEGRTSSVIQWFYYSTPEGERSPFGAWIVPLFAWGIFAIAMLATLVAIARMVMEQWVVNERLAFPLVQVHMALIEAPEKGTALNSLFRSPALWIGLVAVFAIYGLSALNTYLPRYFPSIPLGYDMTDIFSEEPLQYLRPRVKRATLYFSLIGLTFFIRAKVAFSLWGFFLLINLLEVQQGMMQVQDFGRGDRHLGAVFAFVGGILWIGRHHWMRIIRNAFGIGEDRTYGVSFWVAVGGIVIMLGWLWVVGVQLWMALIIVAFIIIAHLVVARVVAETGLPFFRSSIVASQVYSNFPAAAVTGKDVFFGGVFTALGPLTTRDGMMGHSLNGLAVCRNAGMSPKEQRWLGGVLAWAIVLGFVVAAGATLYGHYSHATPMTRDDVPQRNYFGAVHIPEREVSTPFMSFKQRGFPEKPHNSFMHMGIGFVSLVLLQVASLRWAAWPFLPVGYIASYGNFIQVVWFSVFIGWLVKVLIVRYGGASLFQRARPFFVGIIFGEALAAGAWLLVNAVLVWQGADSRPVHFLP